MSLSVKRDGTAVWRGKPIGLFQHNGHEWLFVSETVWPIIPHAECAMSKSVLRDKLTREIVKNEKSK